MPRERARGWEITGLDEAEDPFRGCLQGGPGGIWVKVDGVRVSDSLLQILGSGLRVLGCCRIYDGLDDTGAWCFGVRVIV